MARDATDVWIEQQPDPSDRWAFRQWLNAMPEVRSQTIERPAPKPEPKLVKERQVGREEMDAMISDLRAELIGMIEDAIANLYEELRSFALEAAGEAAEAAGEKINDLESRMEKIERSLIERGLRLVKNDAA